MSMVTTFETASQATLPDCGSDAEPAVLELDEQTLKDLEVFHSDMVGATLFDLCNFTRSGNGGKALRERMKRPFSNPDSIRSVQTSLALIHTHRAIFEQLPNYIITQTIDRYFKATMPPLMSQNIVDFNFGVFDLLFNDVRRYDKITQGVGVTNLLLDALREIVFAEQLNNLPDCELKDIVVEIRSLLRKSRLARIPDDGSWSLEAWRILRIDQTFRLLEKEALHRILQLTYELDALLSMSQANQHHGFCIPTILDGNLAIKAEGVFHPLVPNAIANPVTLNQQSRLLFLTGPNMAGKTTYLRSVAVCVYFAHLGMGVPARTFQFVPAQRLFSSISLADNMHTGVSFFRAEALRVKAIATALAEGYKVIALMDEPFKGTNVKDALDASRVIMESFTTKNDCLFMFSSHLIELSDELGSLEQVDCRYFEAQEDSGKLSFEYILHKGVSSQRLGMRVLQEEGIFELLDRNEQN